MSKVPSRSCEKVIAALKRDGWVVVCDSAQGKHMSKAKRRAQLKTEERLRDAGRWLRCNNRPSDLVAAYSRRYRVSRETAVDDLNRLGYGDDVKIQQYEAEGIPWEFIVEPCSGDMYVVPQGTTHYELHTYHGVF